MHNERLKRFTFSYGIKGFVAYVTGNLAGTLKLVQRLLLVELLLSCNALLSTLLNFQSWICFLVPIVKLTLFFQGWPFIFSGIYISEVIRCQCGLKTSLTNKNQ